MKISTKGRYGLEALLDLAMHSSKGHAIHSSKGHASLKSISERCGISEAYILQIFLILRRTGIVESVRGAQGGYMLARDPSEITVGDVLRALEGPLAVVDENTENTGTSETSIQNCIRINVWDRMNSCLNALVDSITLEDLADNYRKMNEIQTVMYYI